MVRYLPISLLLLVAGGPAAAVDYRVDGLRILEHGIYTAEVVRRKTHSNGTIVDGVTGIHRIEDTIAIPAKKRIRFGLRYVILGAPVGAPIELQLVTRVPAPGLQRPRATAATRLLEHDSLRLIGQIGYRDYAFEHEWELIPGIWTFEFWHKAKKLGAQDFCVYEAQPGGKGSCYASLAREAAEHPLSYFHRKSRGPSIAPMAVVKPITDE